MNEFLALFLPSSLGTIIYLRNTNKSVEKLGLYVYFLITLLTNLSIYAFMYFVMGTKDFNFSNIFTIKYSLIGLGVSLVFSIIFVIISKYVKLEVSIEEVKNEREVIEKQVQVKGISEEKEESKSSKKQKKKYRNNK